MEPPAQRLRGLIIIQAMLAKIDCEYLCRGHPDGGFRKGYLPPFPVKYLTAYRPRRVKVEQRLDRVPSHCRVVISSRIRELTFAHGPSSVAGWASFALSSIFAARISIVLSSLSYSSFVISVKWSRPKVSLTYFFTASRSSLSSVMRASRRLWAAGEMVSSAATAAGLPNSFPPESGCGAAFIGAA